MKQIELCKIDKKYNKKHSRVYIHVGFILVDDEHYDFLMKYNWWPHVSHGNIYAYARIDGKMIYMHALLLPDVPKDYTRDHINGNSLDNRMINLRICTKSQNMANQGLRSDNTSGYKGVSKTSEGKFESSLQCKGIGQHLGFFNTPEEAALCYNKAAKEAFGEFAQLNNLPEKK